MGRVGAMTLVKVKTVKLDDFTAPDDNTDLDASASKHGLIPKADKIKVDTVASNADVTGSSAPQAHKASHQNGGGDKISVAGLSGELADAQPPKSHNAASHSDITASGTDIDDAVSKRHTAGTDFIQRLTLIMLRWLDASGTWVNNPTSLFNNNPASVAQGNAENQYCEQLFAAPYTLTQFRHYGSVAMTGDGRLKLQILNSAGSWVDYKTGIPVRVTADWSGWDSSGGTVIAAGVRWVITTVDTQGTCISGELEVKY